MNFRGSSYRVACTVLAIGTLPTVASPASAQTFEATITLPSMPLGEALRQVARLTGRNVIVNDALVAGRQSPAVNGRFSPEQAVSLLISGSGLDFRQVGNALVITAQPLPVSKVSDSSIVADPGGTVTVTGSNVRGAQPTSPIVVIDRRAIDQAAPASVEELLRKLPQNLSSGVGQENFGVSGTGADITEHGAGVNLRGLGQRATLTLVNGRRLAPSGSGSFVDISLIPISAVERIEIVTDGASAIYGSDAVGGVVNIILRNKYEGLETFAQAGSATKGDGDQLLLGATAGHRWSTGQGLISYEYRREDEIKAGDRDFTINLPPSWSLLPSERRHSIYAKASQDISRDLTLDLTGIWAIRDTERSFFIAGPVVPVDAKAHARTLGGTAALQWNAFADWRIDASASLFASKTRQRQEQPDGQGLVNSFDTENRVADFEIKANGGIVALPGGTLKGAFGAQLRREQYDAVFETQVNAPNPQSADRTVTSLYGELAIPIVGSTNRRPGLERLMLTGALRYDKYRGFGSSTDPKVGILWSPISGLAFRGSYSTSFRAPLLSEIVGLYNVFLFPSSLLYLTPSTAPAGVGAAVVGANPNVRPETSKSFTAGFDWTPDFIPGLSLNATYYRVRFANRIALPTDQIAIVGNPAFEPIVTHFPDASAVSSLFGGAGQLLDFSGPGFSNGNASASDVVVVVDARISNTAVTLTSGFDIGGSYSRSFGEQNLRLDLNLNRVLRFDDRLTASSPVIKTLNTPFHPVDLKVRGIASWAFRRASANVAINYTAGYRDNRGTRRTPVSSFTTIDLGFAYQIPRASEGLARGLRVSLNIQNLFDQDPPRLQPDPGFTRGIGYDPVNANGRGRTVALQLRKSW